MCIYCKKLQLATEAALANPDHMLLLSVPPHTRQELLKFIEGIQRRLKENSPLPCPNSPELQHWFFYVLSCIKKKKKRQSHFGQSI